MHLQINILNENQNFENQVFSNFFQVYIHKGTDFRSRIIKAGHTIIKERAHSISILCDYILKL